MNTKKLKICKYTNNNLNNLGRDTATAKANYCGPGFPYGLLQAENIRSARCSRVVLSKLLAARKGNFLSLLVLANKSQRSHARECSQRPFVTPLNEGLSRPFPLWTYVLNCLLIYGHCALVGFLLCEILPFM